jgi:hypothetical protein
MYHLMTGVLPIISKDRYSAIRGGGTDPLPPANEVRPDIPPRVAVFLKQAMAIMPESRFVSAKAMMRELQEIKSLLKTDSNKSQPTTLPMAAHNANRVQHIPHERKFPEVAQEIYRDETESAQSERISRPSGSKSDKGPQEAKAPSQPAPRILWLNPVSSFKKDAVGDEDEVVPKIVRVTRPLSSPKRRLATKL